MTDLPEVAWLYAFPQDKPITRTWADWKEYKNSVEFLRADTAIPRTEADAMVAAAYAAARDAAICAKSAYAAPTARIDIANAIDRLAKDDARAALERAVREAVEAERERCAGIVAEYAPNSSFMEEALDLICETKETGE